MKMDYRDLKHVRKTKQNQPTIGMNCPKMLCPLVTGTRVPSGAVVVAGVLLFRPLRKLEMKYMKTARLINIFAISQ
jgi:hypothetical protein